MEGQYKSLDDVPDWTFAKEMVEYFGFERATNLIGYCILWGLTGKPDLDDLQSETGRRRHRTSTWRARRDMKRFGDHLRLKYGIQPEQQQLVYRVTELQAVVAVSA